MRLSRSVNRILAVLWLLVGASSAHAQFLTNLTVTTSVSAGNTVYEYELTNLQNNSLSAISLRINVDPLANLTNISSSLGWLATYQAVNDFVVWEATDPSMDLLPGNSARFFMTSPLSPGLRPYGILGFNETTLDFAFNEAQVLSPSQNAQIVPEPGSRVLISLGLICIAAQLNWRRREV